MPSLNAKEYANFESIKHISDDLPEFWYARELAPALKYMRWENFLKVINKAMIACQNSGYDVLQCFREVTKTSKMPNGGVKQVIDYELTRYACYLIVQNGDPRKEVYSQRVNFRIDF